MTDTFFIMPAHPRATILDPASNERLPIEGALKPRDPYWLGLVMRGDVIESQSLPPVDSDVDAPAIVDGDAQVGEPVAAEPVAVDALDDIVRPRRGTRA